MGIFGTSKLKLFGGDEKIKKAYLGTEKIYSAGNIVTYRVDSGVTYQEEVDSDASCLNPTTFTPSKSGWEFVGWKTHDAANADVLSSKIMGDEPVALYAVFKQSVACNFISHNKTETKYGTRYYNCGNIANGSVEAPTGASYSGWTWMGWSGDDATSASAGVIYANGDTVSGLASTENHYGLYQQQATITFKSYNSTQYASGYKYYNASGNSVNATITAPSGASYPGWSWRGWTWTTSADTPVNWANGDSIDCNGSTTVYGLYQQQVTNAFVSYNSTQYASGTRYYNAYGSLVDATVYAPHANPYSGWTYRGWSAANNTTANASAVFGNDAKMDGCTASATYYALYQKNVMLYYQFSHTGHEEHKTAYYNASGNVSYPRFTVSDPSLSGATFLGWGDGTTALYTSTISNYEIQNDMYVYAVFKYNDKTITCGSDHNDTYPFTYIDWSLYTRSGKFYCTNLESGFTEMYLCIKNTSEDNNLGTCYGWAGYVYASDTDKTKSFSVDSGAPNGDYCAYLHGNSSQQGYIVLHGKTVVG